MHCMREPRRVPVSAAIRLHTTSFGSLAATVVVGAAGAGVADVAVGAVIAGAGADEAVVAGVVGVVGASAAIEDEAPNATTAAAVNTKTKLRKINPLHCSDLPLGDQFTWMSEIVQAQFHGHKQ